MFSTVARAASNTQIVRSMTTATRQRDDMIESNFVWSEQAIAQIACAIVPLDNRRLINRIDNGGFKFARPASLSRRKINRTVFLVLIAIIAGHISAMLVISLSFRPMLIVVFPVLNDEAITIFCAASSIACAHLFGISLGVVLGRFAIFFRGGIVICLAFFGSTRFADSDTLPLPPPIGCQWLINLAMAATLHFDSGNGIGKSFVGWNPTRFSDSVSPTLCGVAVAAQVRAVVNTTSSPKWKFGKRPNCSTLFARPGCGYFFGWAQRALFCRLYPLAGIVAKATSRANAASLFAATREFVQRLLDATILANLRFNHFGIHSADLISAPNCTTPEVEVLFCP